MKSGKDKKGSKPSPPKEEEKEPEIPLDFSNPHMLINELLHPNVGRVLQALKGLRPFVRQDSLTELLDNGLIEKIIIIVNDKKSVTEVIEFSLELLSELLNFKIVIKRITEEKDFVILLYSSIKTKPFDVQVQCFKCFSSLSSSPTICEYLAQNCDLNLLYLRLGQHDPDMKACILKILYNLVTSDIAVAEKVVNEAGFDFSPFLTLLHSEYPLVQHRSLKMIFQLTSYDHVQVLKNMFIEEKGIGALIQILETHKWPDLHDKVFDILVNLSNLEETFNIIEEKGIKMLLTYVDEIESQTLQFKSYNTLVKITKNSPYGLKLFVENGFFDLVLKYIEDDLDDNMFKLSVAAISVLSESSEALTLMESKPTLIETMFTVLKNLNKKTDWQISLNAATAIHLMISKSEVFYNFVIKKRLWETILNLLYQNNEKPYDFTLLLATILRRMIGDVYKSLNCPGRRCHKLITALQNLIMSPEGGGDELKCTATEMVEELVEFPEFREELRNKKLYKSLSKLLFRTGENLPVLEAYLKLFITLIEWDPSFIVDLNYVKAIEWFIDKREIHRNLPIARRFLDLVFDKCKYMKFYFTNRLEPWDKIQTGFFAERAFSTQLRFRSLRSFLQETCIKERSCYYVNFNDSLTRTESTQVSTNTYFGDTVSVNSMDDECVIDSMESLSDPLLSVKLKELKVLLGYSPLQKVALNLSQALDREKYIIQLKMLSEYVCELLSGDDREGEECQNHCFGLHISEIKKKLRSTVVPIGYLKLGLKFEKALLFKTLGDQVGIPSALVRGSCGTAWNEIYLPPHKELKSESIQIVFSKEKQAKRLTMNQDKDKSPLTQSRSYSKKSTNKSEKRPSKRTLSHSKSVQSSQDAKEPLFPASWYLHAYQSYMKTNHVIDLDRNPGNLYQIESIEADDYITKVTPVHPYFYRGTNLPPHIRHKISPNLSQLTLKQ